MYVAVTIRVASDCLSGTNFLPLPISGAILRRASASLPWLGLVALLFLVASV